MQNFERLAPTQHHCSEKVEHTSFDHGSHLVCALRVGKGSVRSSWASRRITKAGYQQHEGNQAATYISISSVTLNLTRPVKRLFWALASTGETRNLGPPASVSISCEEGVGTRRTLGDRCGLHAERPGRCAFESLALAFSKPFGEPIPRRLTQPVSQPVGVADPSAKPDRGAFLGGDPGELPRGAGDAGGAAGDAGLG